MKKSLLFSLAAVIFTVTVLLTKADAAWIKDSKGWWNSEDNGYSIGWRYIDNNWYFFNNEGYMVTGWLLTDGQWYYFYDNGVMARDTTIDKYYLGNDGAWIEEDTNENVTIDDDNIREAIFNNLSDKEKKRVKDYKSATIYKEVLEKGMGVINDESYIGKEVYAADFETTALRVPNNISVFATMDKFKIIGYGYID